MPSSREGLLKLVEQLEGDLHRELAVNQGLRRHLTNAKQEIGQLEERLRAMSRPVTEYGAISRVLEEMQRDVIRQVAASVTRAKGLLVSPARIRAERPRPA